MRDFAHTAERLGRGKRKHTGSHLPAAGRGLGRSLLSRPVGEAKPASAVTLTFWPLELKGCTWVGSRARQGTWQSDHGGGTATADAHFRPTGRLSSLTTAGFGSDVSNVAGRDVPHCGPPTATMWHLPMDKPASGSFGIPRDVARPGVG